MFVLGIATPEKALEFFLVRSLDTIRTAPVLFCKVQGTRALLGVALSQSLCDIACMKEIPDDLTQKEVAAGAVSVSLRTLDSAIADGRIASFSRGGKVVVSMADVKEWRSARTRPIKPLRDVTFEAGDSFTAAFGGVAGSIPDLCHQSTAARGLAVVLANQIVAASGVTFLEALEFIASGTLPQKVSQ